MVAQPMRLTTWTAATQAVSTGPKAGARGTVVANFALGRGAATTPKRTIDRIRWSPSHRIALPSIDSLGLTT